MSEIQWTPMLRLGVESIDEQHKQLIDISNHLVAAVRAGKIEESKKLFHSLREYTVVHFNDEEHYMQSIRYPGLDKHRAEHLSLKFDVKMFQDNLYRQSAIHGDEVVAFIKHWLIDHVVHTDLDIKKYLLQQEQAVAEDTAT